MTKGVCLVCELEQTADLSTASAVETANLFGVIVGSAVIAGAQVRAK
jgi:hypothetical protein